MGEGESVETFGEKERGFITSVPIAASGTNELKPVMVSVKSTEQHRHGTDLEG